MVVFYILPSEFACLSHNCTTQHSAQHDSHGQRDWRAKERLPEEKTNLVLMNALVERGQELHENWCEFSLMPECVLYPLPRFHPSFTPDAILC
jgi:hypothetical protein